MKLSALHDLLKTSLGSTWYEYEPESILHELKIEGEATKFVNDQIEVLRCLEFKPELVFNDGLFFLHFIDVANNNVAEFSTIPFPTSLELAWAIKELKRILGTAGDLLPHSEVIKAITTRILQFEGYKAPTKWFKEFVYENMPWVDNMDSDKEKAIGLYIDGMDKQ